MFKNFPMEAFEGQTFYEFGEFLEQRSNVWVSRVVSLVALALRSGGEIAVSSAAPSPNTAATTAEAFGVWKHRVVDVC